MQDKNDPKNLPPNIFSHKLEDKCSDFDPKKFYGAQK